MRLQQVEEKHTNGLPDIFSLLFYHHIIKKWFNVQRPQQTYMLISILHCHEAILFYLQM